MSATTTPKDSFRSFLGEDPNVNRLYDNIQAVIPAATLPIIKMAAWNTIEDFYVRSTYRRESVTWVMAVGVSIVDFNPYDSNWLVAWVLEVSGLSHFRIQLPGAIIAEEPNQSLRHGRALLALKPASFGAEMPPDLWSNWFEVILAGAQSKLYAMPMKPFSSPQLAGSYGAAFAGGIARARAIADHGYSDGGGRWGYPYFARGVRKN